MRALVTRPYLDAHRVAAKLADLGIEGIAAPLMDIVYTDGPALDLAQVQAVLFTSANGVRAFARRSVNRSKPVLCVGAATAQQAAAEGFTKVKSANGDVATLAALVLSTLKPNGGELLHPAAGRVAGDLKSSVEQAGFTYRREILYSAVKVQVLPDTAVQALQSRTVQGVLFYSPRTATAFSKLIHDGELEPTITGLTAYCLSGAVAKMVSNLGWASIKIAPQPNQDALLALL